MIGVKFRQDKLPGVAQSAERVLGKDEVGGSNPLEGFIKNLEGDGHDTVLTQTFSL